MPIDRYRTIVVTDKKFIIAFDIEYFDVTRFIEPSQKYEVKKDAIVFNTGYFSSGKALGVQEALGVKFGMAHGKGKRPVLEFDNGVKSEIGPLLVKEFHDVHELGMREGQFQPDVMRKASHTVFGRTASGLIIAGWYREELPVIIMGDIRTECMGEIGEDIAWLAKGDGGASAMMSAFGVQRGRSSPVVGLEFSWSK